MPDWEDEMIRSGAAYRARNQPAADQGQPAMNILQRSTNRFISEVRNGIVLSFQKVAEQGMANYGIHTNVNDIVPERVQFEPTIAKYRGIDQLVLRITPSGAVEGVDVFDHDGKEAQLFQYPFDRVNAEFLMRLAGEYLNKLTRLY